MGSGLAFNRICAAILTAFQVVALLFGGHLRQIAAATLGIQRRPGTDPETFVGKRYEPTRSKRMRCHHYS